MEFNSSIFEAMRTISEIIKAAGGAGTIAAASDGGVSAEAVYKWPKIGIPDRHWPLVMPMANATAAEMLAANMEARHVPPLSRALDEASASGAPGEPNLIPEKDAAA